MVGFSFSIVLHAEMQQFKINELYHGKGCKRDTQRGVKKDFAQNPLRNP
jgi:hypothetical protein